jgi:hypothetical protein
MKNKNVIYFIIFIIFFFIILFYNYYKKKESFQNIIQEEQNLNKKILNLNQYSNFMIDNYRKNLFKIGLSKDTKIYYDDCFLKCDRQKCINFENRRKLLKKCLECNKKKNKCFKKSIIGLNCDDCDIENIEDKEDCYKIYNYGCPNPNNVNNLEINSGVDPYFIEMPNNNLNSPYNKKCVFCTDLLDSL